jgi:hypothetical protein
MGEMEGRNRELEEEAAKGRDREFEIVAVVVVVGIVLLFSLCAIAVVYLPFIGFRWLVELLVRHLGMWGG